MVHGIAREQSMGEKAKGKISMHLPTAKGNNSAAREGRDQITDIGRRMAEEA